MSQVGRALCYVLFVAGRRLGVNRNLRPVDGWLVRRALAKYPAPSTETRAARLLRSLHEWPYSVALALQAITLAVAAGLFAVAACWLAWWAPTDPGQSLNVLWQVHGVFVSLAFAGLALIFQLGSESLVTGRSLRTALFRQTLFKFTFAYSVFSLVQIGIVANWLPDDSTLILEFVVAAAAIGLVTYAYAQAASVFEDPEKGERLGVKQLREALERSQRQDWANGYANSMLLAAFPGLIGPPPAGSGLMRTGMVVEAGLVADINESLLRSVVADLSMLTSALKAVYDPVGDQSWMATPKAELRLKCRIGTASGSARPAFELYHPNISEKKLTEIDRQLRACLELARE